VRKHPALREAPSGKVVEAAWSRLQDAVAAGADLDAAASVFLDRIGFEGLDRPESIGRMGNDTARVVTQLFGRPWTYFGEECGGAVVAAVSQEMVLRLTDCDPTATGWDTTHATVGVTWLNGCVRRIVAKLPEDESARNILTAITELPIVSTATATSVKDTQLAIVEHPMCPPGFLRRACLNGERRVAREAMRHPECPEDAQVAAALRFIEVA